MVNRCVAAGCSNTPSEKISLFKFPRDRALRNQWEKQVRKTRAQWKATEHSYLCSEHFTDDCFKVDSTLASKFGISKRRRLKPGSIPTIFYRSSTPCSSADSRYETPLSRKRSAASSTDGRTVPKRKRGAVEKRVRREVYKIDQWWTIVLLGINYFIGTTDSSRGARNSRTCHYTWSCNWRGCIRKWNWGRSWSWAQQESQ